MNEEIVEEIYNKLVERFGITEIFLPKYRQFRLQDITWEQFIKVALESDYKGIIKLTGQSKAAVFIAYVSRAYPEIREDKQSRPWFNYLCSLISKKRCSCCGLVLDYSAFTNKSSLKDGLDDRCRLCKKSYRILNKDNISKVQKEYYNNHTTEYNFYRANHRAAKLKATPNWANLITIKEIYRTCPEGYHVDHIVPLQNDLVCGLHCEFNLQHLPASENLSKSNKFEIT